MPGYEHGRSIRVQHRSCYPACCIVLFCLCILRHDERGSFTSLRVQVTFPDELPAAAVEMLEKVLPERPVTEFDGDEEEPLLEVRSRRLACWVSIVSREWLAALNQAGDRLVRVFSCVCVNTGCSGMLVLSLGVRSSGYGLTLSRRRRRHPLSSHSRLVIGSVSFRTRLRDFPSDFAMEIPPNPRRRPFLLPPHTTRVHLSVSSWTAAILVMFQTRSVWTSAHSGKRISTR